MRSCMWMIAYDDSYCSYRYTYCMGLKDHDIAAYSRLRAYRSSLLADRVTAWARIIFGMGSVRYRPNAAITNFNYFDRRL